MRTCRKSFIGIALLFLIPVLHSVGQVKQKKQNFYVSHNVVSISSSFVDPEDCATGGNNGIIDIDVTGGSGYYSFAWEKNGTPGFSTLEDLTGLTAGDYSVNITDDMASCTYSQSFTVDYYCPYACSGFNFTFTNFTDSDCGTASGEIEADVSGGTFTYELIKYSRFSGTGVTIQSGTDVGPATLSFTSLEPGEYVLSTEETATGCTYSGSTIILANDFSIIAANPTDNSSCTAPNGQIAISLDNPAGANDFSYKVKNLLTGVASTRNSTAPNEVFSGLLAGLYQIQVIDLSDGCSIESSANVGNLTSLSVNLAATFPQTTCSPPNGGASVNVTGGTGGYLYFWSNGVGTKDLINSAGGTFSFFVFDPTSRCTGSLSNVIIPNTTVLPNLGVSITDNTNCAAPYNGAINLTVSATPGPHTFEWRNDVGTVVSTAEDPTSLPPGGYGVKVTNQPTNCSRTISLFDGVVIDDTSSPPITINLVSAAPNSLCTTAPGNGAISVTVDAGGAPYTTTWSSPSGFSASNIETLVDLPSDDYELTVEVACSGSPPALTSATTSQNFSGSDLVIDPMIQVTDSDSPDLQAAQVSFVIGYLSAEDRLLFVNQAGLTGSFNPATGVLSITGSASVAVYQTALRSVAFQNNANPRTKAVRRIAFEVSDGSFTSNASTVEINFPNQVPALTGTPPQSLYGNVGPALFPNAVVTDVDDVNLISAQIAIVSGLQAGSDELLFDLQPGISGSFVSTTGLLTLSGSSAIINYQNALRSVRFRNLDPAITTVTRQIQFNVQDGAGTSNSVSTSVAINQPPAISSPPPQALSGPLVSLDVAPLISDPNNNADLTTLAITVPPQSGAVASLSGTVLLLDYTDVEFSGTDQLQVAVCDFLGACGQQILNIEIEGDFVVYNAVSANGDNLNSFFYLRNIKPGNRVTIFNRWGDVVYATSDYDNQNRRFTGISDSGKELPSGTYFYRIEMANMPTRTGFLSLKR